MFLAKKKEAELKAKSDRERQYQSMFKPHLTTSFNKLSSANIHEQSLNDSLSNRHAASTALEKSETLYKAGKEKLQMIKHLKASDMNRLERSYDENLTFQPVINKHSAKKSKRHSDNNAAHSETRTRIDELCKKVSSSSAMRRYNHRNSVAAAGKGGRSERSGGSMVSSVESERGLIGGVNKEKSERMLGEKLDKELMVTVCNTCKV